MRKNPWAVKAFPAGPRDGLETFRAEADQHAVFLIDDTEAAEPPPRRAS